LEKKVARRQYHEKLKKKEEKTGHRAKIGIQQNNCFIVIRCAGYTRSKFQLTVNNVHLYTTGIRIAWLAPVNPGVARHGFLDHQTTRCLGTFFSYQTDTATRRVEIDNLHQKTSQYIHIFFKKSTNCV